jgi:hypothetical protein
MLERSPQLMWPAVANPTVLDFAEAVVGPFVQLDNLTLAAFLPMDVESRKKVRGTTSGYHRDRWGRMPNGNYERPLAFNAITYLQDLTDDNGPVRASCYLCIRHHARLLRFASLQRTESASRCACCSSASFLAATCSQLSSVLTTAPDHTATKKSFT